ncbi:hypothetical protein CANCADRAFT_22000 [Tortispora caseinolytica NRRL Y-17796]|uniref:Peroxisomal biogenesis factor 11 n=1 Tax=Tortispora caseinolytica NRRL Y-17796 TaxID=767744 RepID=A0A1E4TKT1_9ASCO|nr:hypothetical protein CANCADRAFT_22000 [Tortispora caseinolytica NRRL Y-17796]
MKDAIVYHPVYSQLVRFLNRAQGRDKLVRLAQYVARLLLALDPAQAARWRTLMGQLAMSRKIFRLGKPLSHLQLAAKALDNKQGDPLLRYSVLLRQLGMALYFTHDGLNILYQLKVLTPTKTMSGPIAQRRGFLFWTLALSAGIAGGVYKLVGLAAQIRALRKVTASKYSEAEDKIALEKANTQVKEAVLQLIQDVCDITIPTAGLYGSFTDGTVGAAGIISSLLGFRTEWMASASR